MYNPLWEISRLNILQFHSSQSQYRLVISKTSLNLYIIIIYSKKLLSRHFVTWCMLHDFSFTKDFGKSIIPCCNQNMWDAKKASKWKMVYLNWDYEFFSFSRYLEENKIFKLYNLSESYRNVYRNLSAKCKFHDENVFLKADKALSKWIFQIHLKLKKFSN